MSDPHVGEHLTREDLANAREERIAQDLRTSRRPVLTAKVVGWAMAGLAGAVFYASVNTALTHFEWWQAQSLATRTNLTIGLVCVVLTPVILTWLAFTHAKNAIHLGRLRFLELRLDESVDAAVFRWATGGDATDFRRHQRNHASIGSELEAELVVERRTIDAIAESIEFLLEHLDGTDTRIKRLMEYRELMAAYVKIIDQMTERHTAVQPPAELEAEAAALQAQLRDMAAANRLPAE